MPEKAEPTISHQSEFNEPQKPSVGKIVLFIVLAIVVFAAAVGGTYYYMNKKLTEQKKTQQAQIDELNAKVTELQKSQATTPITAPAQEFSVITPSGGTGIQFVLPKGWLLDSNQISKTLNGIKYVLISQITENDYLKGNYGGNASLIKATKTANGTPIYVIKTANDQYVALSSCPPVNGKGCSFTQNGKPLLFLMYTYQTGDQFVRGVDFNNPTTTEAIQGAISFAESLKI